MREQFDGWQRSSHRSVAVCNDCHAPHDFIGKYMTKGTNGFWHSFYFTTGRFPDPIQITPRNARGDRRRLSHLPRRDGQLHRHAFARRHADDLCATATATSAICTDMTSTSRHRAPAPLHRFGCRAGSGSVTALLVNIFERKQEARNPFFQVVELTDETGDPAIWAGTFRSSTMDTGGRSIRSGRSTVAARPCRGRRPTSIHARSWRSHDWRKTRGSAPCGRATPLRRTFAKSAAMPTCSTIRPTPSASR